MVMLILNSQNSQANLILDSKPLGPVRAQNCEPEDVGDLDEPIVCRGIALMGSRSDMRHVKEENLVPCPHSLIQRM